MSSRSSKRKRREPVRHPIPAARLTTPPRQPAPDPDNPRLPVFDGTAVAPALIKGSVEAVPLYAVLAMVHQQMSGAPANACLPVCHQVAEALRLLGFDAVEPMAAYVEVVQGGTRHVDIGVLDRPVLRPDHTTNGHLVLWAAPFGRLVDPTIAQHPALLAAAHRGAEVQTAPLVISIPGGRDTLVSQPVGAVRPPFQINYLVQPENTAAFDPWFAEFRDGLDHGGLGLAHLTLECLTILATMRNLRELPHLYPRLGALLSADEQLPPLPDQPPAAWTRLKNLSRR